MNTAKKRSRCLAAAGLAFLGLIATSGAQVLVDTLGGGPRQGYPAAAGYTDGNTFAVSQFNNPYGIALDSTGNLFIADKSNGKVRKVTLPGDAASSLTSTFATGLNQPVGVVFDGANNLYVLTQADGKIRKYNSFGNLIATNVAGLTNATAITIDGSANLYVTQLIGTTNGVVKKITPAGVVTVVATNLNQPKGLVMLDNGLIAVSDTGNHAVRLVNPANGVKTLLAGGNGAGFGDGLGAFAQFNQPHGVSKSPSGILVVADKLNHRFRLVETNGVVSTLYGMGSAQWVAPYPGWEDGSPTVAEAHDPVAATVSPLGKVFTTEVFYHLLRQVTGAPLGVGGTTTTTNGPGTNAVVVVSAPIISPNSGYYPMGQPVTVTSADLVHYTTDGTEPTVNSPQVAMNGNVGTIQFNEPLRDLTSLRVKAFSGTNGSSTVGGVASSVNEVGFSRDVNAGIGSTVVIPVVANLRNDAQLRSIQFRVEITPLNGGPAILPQFKAVPVTGNDFLQVAGASVPGTIGTYTATPYSVGITRGLVVSAIGTNANFLVQHFAAVSMLVVPIDPSAVEGQTYSLSVSFLSGTSDGLQAPVALTPIVSRTLTISNLSYTVGDSSPGTWYNAGEFGNGNLNNNDVNNVFYASLGIRTPYTFSDLFDAMDTFPPDDVGFLGGDGEIKFLDWQLVLLRSLQLDTNNWRRFWTVGGVRDNATTTLNGAASTSKNSVTPPAPGTVWLRHALIGAQSLANVSPGGTYNIPIYTKVAPGYSLAGLSFRTTLTPDQNAPAVAGLQFIPANGVPAPIVGTGNTPAELLCGWPLVPSPSFVPVLQSSNLLGYIRFQAPSGAQAGQSYTLRFFNSDGSPDINTAYKLESVPGRVWVLAAAAQPAEIISDEWKTSFFGSVSNALAAANADPDGDGVPNWKEFLAGTNPTNATSRLQLGQAQWTTNAGSRALVLSWLSAPGKQYVLECSSSVTASNWTTLASGIMGDGTLRSFTHSNLVNNAQFYRVRLQP